jgi:predicted DNA-binding protein
MALTKKQDVFCIEVIKQATLSDAYRIAYETKNMSDKQINEEASLLMKNPKITQRVQELKNEVSKKELYTIEQSIKRDLNLIERYESALDVLENDKSSNIEIQTAERTIKFIGSTGYNSAQDRLSKQHGFFERDNSQKSINIDVIDYSKLSDRTLREIESAAENKPQ